MREEEKKKEGKNIRVQLDPWANHRLHSCKRIVQYFPCGTGGIISSCFIY